MNTTTTRKRCRKCDRSFAGNGNWCNGCRAEQSKRMKIVAESQADDEPTMAELEAMIAEQMQCLPPWWNHHRS